VSVLDWKTPVVTCTATSDSRMGAMTTVMTRSIPGTMMIMVTLIMSAASAMDGATTFILEANGETQNMSGARPPATAGWEP
jgi:hypothetical protein